MRMYEYTNLGPGTTWIYITFNIIDIQWLSLRIRAKIISDLSYSSTGNGWV